MGTLIETSWQRNEYEFYRPDDCYAELDRMGKPEVLCKKIFIPQDYFKFCSELGISPTSKDIFAYMDEENRLLGEPSDWLQNDDDEGHHREEVETIYTNRNHPGQCLTTLRSQQLTQCNKDIAWALSKLKPLLASKATPAPFDSDLVKPSYFTKQMRLSCDQTKEAAVAALRREVRQDKNSPWILRGAFEELYEPPVEQKRTSLIVEYLEPCPRKALASVAAIPPQPEHQDQTQITVSGASTTQSTAAMNKSNSLARTETALARYLEKDSLEALPVETNATVGQDHTTAVERLPWDRYLEYRTFSSTAVAQDLVKSANSLTLHQLLASLPTLDFSDGSEAICKAKTILAQQHQVVAEQWMLDRVKEHIKEAREATESTRRLAQWTSTFKGKETSMVLPPRATRNDVLLGLWSDEYKKKSWQTLVPRDVADRGDNQTNDEDLDDHLNETSTFGQIDTEEEDAASIYLNLHICEEPSKTDSTMEPGGQQAEQLQQEQDQIEASPTLQASSPPIADPSSTALGDDSEGMHTAPTSPDLPVLNNTDMIMALASAQKAASASEQSIDKRASDVESSPRVRKRAKKDKQSEVQMNGDSEDECFRQDNVLTIWDDVSSDEQNEREASEPHFDHGLEANDDLDDMM